MITTPYKAKIYKPCQYCGGTRTRANNYGEHCVGCGAESTEAWCYYLGKPITFEEFAELPNKDKFDYLMGA